MIVSARPQNVLEGLIEAVKRRDDVKLFVMMQNNRNAVESEILAWNESITDA